MPRLDDLRAMLNPVPFVTALCDAFTGRFVLYISIIYFAVKGFALRSVTAVQLPFYKTYLKVSADDYQKYYNVSMMAFSVKPLVGTLSDNVPILGYHKRYYLTILSALGAAALGCSILLQPGTSGIGPIAAGMFFLVVLSVASMDLLSEGKYSEIMEKHKETGSSIISWIWAMYMLGGIIASGVEGPLADSGDPRIVLLITAPFFIMPIVPSLLGWVPEEQKRAVVHAGDAAEVLPPLSAHDAVITSSSWRHPVATWVATCRLFNTGRKRIIALSVFAAVAAIGLALVSLFGTNLQLVYYIVPTVATLFSASFLVLPPIIAKANIFMFCKELVYIQLNGPLDFFYTDDEQCIPGGPNFSFTFYQTAGNIVTNVGGLLAVYLFQKYLSHGRFRIVFWITTVIKVVASFFDVLIILRWNEKYLGIGDHVMFMGGDMLIRELATMLDFMPASVLISRLCPRGMESTMFALLAGMSNFGQNLSRSVGVLMAEGLDVRTSAPCNVENLYLLVVMGHMVAPLLIIPLSVLLVPNSFMQEPLPEIVAAGVESSDSEEDGTASEEDRAPPTAGASGASALAAQAAPSDPPGEKSAAVSPFNERRAGGGYGTLEGGGSSSNSGRSGGGSGGNAPRSAVLAERRRGTMEEEAETALLDGAGTTGRFSTGLRSRASTRSSRATTRSSVMNGGDAGRAARASMGFGVM